MNKAEIYLRFCEEYGMEQRHHEQQRTSVTGFFAALTAGVLAVLGLDDTLSHADMPAAVFLIVVGILGCILSLKQYERYLVCMERARHFREELEKVVEGSNIKKIKKTADELVNDRFPRLHKSKHGYFWTCLHASIAIFGLVLLFMACG